MSQFDYPILLKYQHKIDLLKSALIYCSLIFVIRPLCCMQLNPNNLATARLLIGQGNFFTVPSYKLHS